MSSAVPGGADALCVRPVRDDESHRVPASPPGGGFRGWQGDRRLSPRHKGNHPEEG